ncbi:hypothetical protein B0J13DRAFT_671686 [Dactylonectria estremocensis]|uniref:MARVEL domain-containing protein n=1 Tax=Dactylonectria estremocensis TaxID=1079267 RepID=A0A9P9FDS6_9HYPO|nr:hypothetical protein B0J13DRAFT_671686 [Dactylonectria estremocensis]
MAKQRPTIAVYPILPWIFTKIFQTISACIVTAIMFEVMSGSRRTTPTTLYFLEGAALLTILVNLIMGVWINRWGPVPKIFAVVNTVMAILWAAGYGFLISSTASVITQSCTAENFGTYREISSCRFYKVLWAFGATGLVSSVTMAVLDIMAARRMKQGKVIVADHERLLAGGAVGTSYRRVGDEERELSRMTAPAGLEPTRHERAL